MLTWRAVERCDHDENYPGVCDFCYALAMAEALVEEEIVEAVEVEEADTAPAKPTKPKKKPGRNKKISFV